MGNLQKAEIAGYMTLGALAFALGVWLAMELDNAAREILLTEYERGFKQGFELADAEAQKVVIDGDTD